MRVYLDDARKAPFGWVRVFTAQQAIDVLKLGNVEEISLDHDLTEEHYAGKFDAQTGYAVVAWLRDEVQDNPYFRMPKVHIHTMNALGRKHMQYGLKQIEGLIESRKRHVLQK